MDERDFYDELLAMLVSSWQGLPDKPEETPAETLRALRWLAAGEQRCIERATLADPPTLSLAQLERLTELVKQRVAGVPLAHLTGRQQFMDIEMLASPQSLIPRKETEILGYAALEILEQLVQERNSVTVIDLCTGSGNLALALAHHEPNCRIFGSDLSPKAVNSARQNANHLGLHNRVTFREGDFFSPFENHTFVGQVDMIVCNPPYIASANVPRMPHEIAGHEPHLAFDGGSFGVNFVFRLISEAARFLKSESWLCFEVGLGQGDAVKSRARKAGHYRHINSACNAEGQVRAILAQT